jgi:hypothetical protein
MMRCCGQVALPWELSTHEQKKLVSVLYIYLSYNWKVILNSFQNQLGRPNYDYLLHEQRPGRRVRTSRRRSWTWRKCLSLSTQLSPATLSTTTSRLPTVSASTPRRNATTLYYCFFFSLLRIQSKVCHIFRIFRSILSSTMARQLLIFTFMISKSTIFHLYSLHFFYLYILF